MRNKSHDTDARPSRGSSRATVALVIALLALVASTTGVAYAAEKAAKNSVVSKSIKNGQVKNKDLGANAVTSDKIADGAVKASDVNIVTVQTTSAVLGDVDGSTNDGPNTDIIEAIAQCPAGTKVIGGGAEWVGTGDTNDNTYLHSSTVSGNGWKAKGINDMGAQGNVQLQVTALCLS
ncbi:hypothetical protein [Pimelobacter simplex]|uniref:hypothetical protein n=1 Tax=Nocardioides simplex TaxID=2045 RepID=UPI0019325D19|nr:hypothetical protein [Pimelobacter simplex]